MLESTGPLGSQGLGFRVPKYQSIVNLLCLATPCIKPDEAPVQEPERLEERSGARYYMMI